MPHYEVTYTKPNNVVVTGPQTQIYTTKAQVRELVKRARKYPGSLEIVSVDKVSKTSRVPMPFWTL